jgi:hypothetical protein
MARKVRVRYAIHAVLAEMQCVTKAMAVCENIISIKRKIYICTLNMNYIKEQLR